MCNLFLISSYSPVHWFFHRVTCCLCNAILAVSLSPSHHRSPGLCTVYLWKLPQQAAYENTVLKFLAHKLQFMHLFMSHLCKPMTTIKIFAYASDRLFNKLVRRVFFFAFARLTFYTLHPLRTAWEGSIYFTTMFACMKNAMIDQFKEV